MRDMFFELICEALPEDILPHELTQYGKPEWWRDRPRMACAYALRKHPRINWSAYVMRYPDALSSGLDPVLHFLRKGVFDGRKLPSWHPERKPPSKETPPAPKVSVIIASYNSSLFLRKCIESLVTQTLDDIEIIIVDDCSTDDSLAIAREYEAADYRVRVIAHANNKNLLATRKSGVFAATGDYVMFLDADDTYIPDACRIAYNAVAKGYDICSFNANCIGQGTIEPARVAQAAKYCNKTKPGEYGREEALRLTFIAEQMLWNVCFKIFERSLATRAYADLEDCSLYYSEDVYAYLSVLTNARKLIHIGDRLYNYAIGTGASTGPDKAKLIELLTDHLPQVQKLCERRKLPGIFKAIEDRYLGLVIYNMNQIPEELRPNILKKYCVKFGIARIFMRLASANPKFIVSLLEDADAIDMDTTCREPLKKIGILYLGLSPGGIERTIQNMCAILPKAGYELVLFLVNKTEYDLKIDPTIRRHYLASYSLDQGKSHFTDLQYALAEERPDIVIHMDLHWWLLPWHLLLLRLLTIPVIGSMRIDHCWDFLHRGQFYPHSITLAAMRRLDKVFCLSRSTKLYLRAQGVDAVYLPNPIREFTSELPMSCRETKIVILTGLSKAHKKVDHALLALAEVVKKRPDAIALFVGNFQSPETSDKFFAKAARLGIKGNVRVTGWIQDPAPYLDEAKVLFSASLLEGFPNNIAEAQARGLPVVMYDLDISIKDENESILVVPKDDYKAAAKAICQLLGDEQEWLRLSAIAREKARAYSAERFAKGLINLLEGYENQSDYQPYKPTHYQRALHYLASYAGTTIPAYFA